MLVGSLFKALSRTRSLCEQVGSAKVLTIFGHESECTNGAPLSRLFRFEGAELRNALHDD